jgi:hypothetical protein
VRRPAAASMNGARTPVLLAAIAIAVGIAACDRSPDRSAAVKPELTPTPPAIAPPPASPAPVMPPKASAVLEPPSQTAAAPSSESTEKQAPAEQTPKGSDANAKEPMSKDEESTAMPKPAQANDHSTTATDGKQ